MLRWSRCGKFALTSIGTYAKLLPGRLKKQVNLRLASLQTCSRQSSLSRGAAQLRTTACQNRLEKMAEDLDTSKITHWRSIVTLIVFVLTSELRRMTKRMETQALSGQFGRHQCALPFPHTDSRTQINLLRLPGLSQLVENHPPSI